MAELTNKLTGQLVNFAYANEVVIMSMPPGEGTQILAAGAVIHVTEDYPDVMAAFADAEERDGIDDVVEAYNSKIQRFTVDTLPATDADPNVQYIVTDSTLDAAGAGTKVYGGGIHTVQVVQKDGEWVNDGDPSVE